MRFRKLCRRGGGCARARIVGVCFCVWEWSGVFFLGKETDGRKRERERAADLLIVCLSVNVCVGGSD